MPSPRIDGRFLSWIRKEGWAWAALLPPWVGLVLLCTHIVSTQTGLWLAVSSLGWLLLWRTASIYTVSKKISSQSTLLSYGMLIPIGWLSFPYLQDRFFVGYVGLYSIVASLGAIRTFRSRLLATTSLLLGQLLIFLSSPQSPLFFLHALGFAILVQLPTWIWDKERKEQQEFHHDKWVSFQEQLAEEAQFFRKEDPGNLATSPEARAYGSLQYIQQTQETLLHLLCQATDATHGVLLQAHADQNQWTLKHACPASHDIHANTTLAWDAGVLGQLIKQKQIIALNMVKSSHLPYVFAHPPEATFSFVGIPLLDHHGTWLGVLCLARLHPFPDATQWTNRAIPWIQQTAQQVVQTVFAERLLAWADRQIAAQSQLYAVSERLNRAQGQAQVYQVAVTTAASLCDAAFSAVTTYQHEDQRHSVVALHSRFPLPSSNLTIGHSFASNAGLIASCIKNGITLPALGIPYQNNMLVFDAPLPEVEIQSILVVPLISEGKALGSWVLGSQVPHAFDVHRRELLGVIANQLAVSIENARRFNALESLATIDGLTQLLNRRTWQERFPNMLARAERNGHPLSVLLTDVDFFKKVNDTHGHPAGDEVLRQVARVVQSGVRKVDLAARYGGEEFVIVLDGADEKSAWQWANRVREEVQGLSFRGKTGTFQCTLSIGIATFPRGGTDQTTLTSHADQALYQAKHNGRNQVVLYDAT